MTSAILSASPPANLNPKPPDLPNQKLNYADKVSFAAALATPKLKPRFQDVPLPNRQYATIDGEPAINFSASEFEAAARCYRFSLIAKFTMGRPTIDTIRQHFQTNWDIKGRATISEIWDGRHLLVILDSETDMVAALTCPMRKIQHAMFRLFRYSPNYNPRVESTTTTKWIRLPGLPPPFFHRSYIGAIVNSFAYFLDTDERTKACASMRYARACIECDVTIPIPGRVWVGLPDNKGFWQDIVVEGNLSYCAHCKIHGHELANCRRKKPSSSCEVGQETTHKQQQESKGTSSDKIVKQSDLNTTQHPNNKAKGKRDTEWRAVTSKKTAKRNNTKLGYGPDLLYANTVPAAETPELTLKPEDINQNQNGDRTKENLKEGDEKNSEIQTTKLAPGNAITDAGTSTLSPLDGKSGTEEAICLSESQIIQAGFDMLASAETGDINNQYSEEDRKTIREGMIQMIQRMEKLKASHRTKTTTSIKEDIQGTTSLSIYPNEA